MTTEQLNNYLADPGAMSAKDLGVIEEYRQKYPYSPVFAALYAKVLHNLKDLKYDEALRDAAIVLPDRGVLYQLIYKVALHEKIASVEKEVDEVIVVSQEIQQEKEVETNQKTPEELPIKKSKEADELEQDILIEAINTTIQLDVDQLLEEEVSDSIEDWSDAKELSEEKVEESSAQDKGERPSKFSDWLFAMKDAKEEEKNIEKKELVSSKELINRFIQSRPRKIDISKEPVTPQEMGRLSLVEDEGFVTETLAEIYAKQGKYHKAIKIYEQLSLKNPEKKVFFASRIRFLREKLEYDK